MERCFLFTALCLMFAATASAQQWSSPKLTVNVPFNFVVGDTPLPAGTYLVMTYVTTEKALIIQNRDRPAYVKIVSNNDVLLSPYEAHERTDLPPGN